MFFIGQFTQAVVSLYWVYCCEIIQQRMFVVDNFHVKIRYTYKHFFHMFLKVVLFSCYQNMWIQKMCICFHMFFKSYVGLVASNCLNAKKNTLGMRYSQYGIELSVDKQPSVFNTTYTVQCCVNCSNIVIWL